MAGAAAQLPWWATGGGETCTFCLQRYHYEVEVRCEDCDGPLCPHCALHPTVEVLTARCPDCAATGDGEEKG